MCNLSGEPVAERLRQYQVQSVNISIAGRIPFLANQAGEHKFTWGFRAHGLVIDSVNNSNCPGGRLWGQQSVI